MSASRSSLRWQVEEDRLALARLAPGALLERATPRVRLDAPAQAAVAAATAGLHADVPDLAGGAAAVEQATVDDQPAADPRAPEDAEERADAAAGTEPALGLDGDADVVPDRDRDAEALREHGPERERLVPAVDVRRLVHDPGRRVDAAGRADADARELVDADTGVRRGLADREREVVGDRGRAALARRVASSLADDLAAARRHDGLDLRPAEVEAAAQRDRHGSRRTTSLERAAVGAGAPLRGRARLRVARRAAADRTTAR